MQRKGHAIYTIFADCDCAQTLCSDSDGIVPDSVASYGGPSAISGINLHQQTQHQNSSTCSLPGFSSAVVFHPMFLGGEIGWCRGAVRVLVARRVCVGWG